MYRLIATVRRGSSADLGPAWLPYPDLEAARSAASVLLRRERVQRVMIVRDVIPQTFVEWLER